MSVDTKAVKDMIRLVQAELKEIKGEFKAAASVVKEVSRRLGKKEKELEKLKSAV